MDAEKSAKDAVEYVRRCLWHADGDELDVLTIFCEQIGSEVDGWNMRREELRQEREDDDD